MIIFSLCGGFTAHHRLTFRHGNSMPASREKIMRKFLAAMVAAAALVIPGVTMAAPASAAPAISAALCRPGFHTSGRIGAVTYRITRGCAGVSFRAKIGNSATLQNSISSWAHANVGATRTALLSGGNICTFQYERTGGGTIHSIPTAC
jgi:hypothetical protein